MNDLIINAPHLQSLQQRLGSYFVAVACWLLWIYFLVPIVTLSGWLMGVRQLAKEIRWFGGYKSLMELMELYGEAISLIAGLWLCWTILTSLLRRRSKAMNATPVTNADLCKSHAVDAAELERCQANQRITVFFDDHGQIVHMEAQSADSSADAFPPSGNHAQTP